MYKAGDVLRLKAAGDLPHDYVGWTFRIHEVYSLDGTRLSCAVVGITPYPDGHYEVGGEPKGAWLSNQWFDSLEKIGEGDLYVGQPVRIKPGSRYDGNGPRNPVGAVGVVRQWREDTLLPITVDWPIHGSNCYQPQDLEVVGDVPAVAPKKPKKTVKKKKSPSLTSKIGEAVKLLNASSSIPTAKYVVIHKNLKVGIDANTACHAGLNDESYKGADYVVSCIKHGIVACPWFYKWLIDESPWSSAFCRRYAWSRKNMAVVVRTDISSTFMFGALFATRIWEAHVGKEFMGMFRRKLPLEFLYPICCQIDMERFAVVKTAGGHFPFSRSPEKIVVKNFVKGKVVKTADNYKDTAMRGGMVSEVFGGQGSQDYWLLTKFSKFPGVVEEEGRWGAKFYTSNKAVLTKFLQSVYEEVSK